MVLDRNAVTQEVPIDPETGKPYLNTVAAIQVSANGVAPRFHHTWLRPSK